MPSTIERKNAVATLTTAAAWLKSVPVLIGVFLITNAISTASQLVPLGSLLSLPVSAIGWGVAHLYAADILEDKSPALKNSLSGVISQLLELLVIVIVTAIGAGIAGIVFILPGIYIALKLSLAPAACVIDKRDIGESLQTSWDITEGNLLKILAVRFLPVATVAVIIGVVLFALGGFEQMLQGNQTPLIWAGFIVLPVTAIADGLSQFSLARIYLENRHKADENAVQPEAADVTEDDQTDAGWGTTNEADNSDRWPADDR